METSSELPPSTTEQTSRANAEHLESSSIASSTLRFPTLATDERVSTWVEHIVTTSMSAHNDDGNALEESTYDLMEDTDTDREDNATESVASTDFGGRPDDVASLADTEGSDDESGDEDHSEHPTQPFPGFEEAVQEAFDTPTIGRSSTVIIEDDDRPLSQSIEFDEPFGLGIENVSVKHTVLEFSEEETARLTESGTFEGTPKRLALTIRQTMTKQGLSTKEPLRILYVGSHSAKQDIIHKIASAVTASVGSDKRKKQSRQSSSQLYNVVPVSAFGSERTPEIELMHSSGYQIKVEDCLRVQRFEQEASPRKLDIIKLTTEDGSYHSMLDGDAFTLEPHWEEPHIAIFYSDNDGNEAVETRKNAGEFMRRHRIPSMTITFKQVFDRDQFIDLDQHSVHMCLESRDASGRMSTIHQRLPIDLTSFLNIDARQMNRNLAHLTGFYEPLQETQEALLSTQKKADAQPLTPETKNKGFFGLIDNVTFIRNHNVAEWRAILPLGLLILSVFAAVFMGIPSHGFNGQSTISINSKVVSNIPISCTSTLTQSALVPSLISTSSVAVSTSTRTITVVHTKPTGPNSLSVVPLMEIGKASQKFQAPPKSNKSVCSAEILGDREILIRIPSATKLSWLTKEAMSVNISRGNDTVDTERAYSSDEGIVLSLPKKEAFGLLKIAVITTRKPRVNETFTVDFKTSPFHTLQTVMDKMALMLSEDYSLSDMRSAADQLVKDAKLHSQATLKHVEEARKLAMQQANSATESLTDLAKSVSLEAAKRSAIISKEVGIQFTEAEARISEKIKSLNSLQEPLNEGIFKAQVQSKLVWLKMQGKNEEYRKYEQAALEATRVKKASHGKKGRSKVENIKRAEEQKRKVERKVERRVKKEAAKEARKAKKGKRA